MVFQEFIKSFEAVATRARLWAWVVGAVVVIPTGLTAVMGYLGGSFGQAPLFQLIPAVLITAASSLWLAIRFMPTGPRRPNPEIWRHRLRFRLRVAACLLADTAPTDQEVDRPGDAQDWFRLLEEAWENGKLERLESDNPDLKIISRQTLQKFAAQHRIKRAFLIDP